jgi:tetratricopeptide (TPR) repeat protein
MLRDGRGLGLSYQMLGFYYTCTGLFDKGIKCFKKSISLCGKFGDLNEVSASLHGLWQCDYHLGAIWQAGKVGRESAHIMQKTSDDYEKSAFDCQNILYYLEKGLLKTALKTGLAVQNYCKQQQFWLTYCIASINLGVVYLEKGKHEPAITMLEKARAIFNGKKLIRACTSQLFAYLAEAYLLRYVKQGDYPLSKVRKLCCTAYRQLKPWPCYYGLALRVLAKYYQVHNQPRKARHFFHASIRQYQKLKKRC